MSETTNAMNRKIETRSVAEEVGGRPDLGEVDLSDLATRLARRNVAKAFDGKSFSITPIKKVLRAADVLRDLRGTGALETLQVAHTVRWDRLEPTDAREMAAVALRMMDLDGREDDFASGSRIRHLIAGTVRPHLHTVLRGIRGSFPEGRDAICRQWDLRKSKAIDLCQHLDSGGEVVVENYIAAIGRRVSQRFLWAYVEETTPNDEHPDAFPG